MEFSDSSKLKKYKNSYFINKTSQFFTVHQKTMKITVMRKDILSRKLLTTH